jgi:hypothetical protein
LKTRSISICEPEIPRICFVRKPTFGNWPSCVSHQANGFAHADEGIKSLLNKDNSLDINDQEDSSIEAPTLNMFASSFGHVASIATIVDVLGIRFSQSKHTIKRGTIALTSYSNANQIAFPRPTKFAIMLNALKWGSNMIAIML